MFRTIYPFTHRWTLHRPLNRVWPLLETDNSGRSLHDICCDCHISFTNRPLPTKVVHDLGGIDNQAIIWHITRPLAHCWYNTSARLILGREAPETWFSSCRNAHDSCLDRYSAHIQGLDQAATCHVPTPTFHVLSNLQALTRLTGGHSTIHFNTQHCPVLAGVAFTLSTTLDITILPSELCELILLQGINDVPPPISIGKHGQIQLRWNQNLTNGESSSFLGMPSLSPVPLLLLNSLCQSPRGDDLRAQHSINHMQAISDNRNFIPWPIRQVSTTIATALPLKSTLA